MKFSSSVLKKQLEALHKKYKLAEAASVRAREEMQAYLEAMEPLKVAYDAMANIEKLRGPDTNKAATPPHATTAADKKECTCATCGTVFMASRVSTKCARCRFGKPVKS